MAELNVVQELSDVLASGREPYSVWATVKAIIQRRYLAPRSHGTFEDCAHLFSVLARVLCSHLCVLLARELLCDLLFQVLHRFAALQSADAGAQTTFAEKCASQLRATFETLLSATVHRICLTGPLPLVVTYSNAVAAEKDVSTDAALVRQHRHQRWQTVTSWAEDVVLAFAIRATLYLADHNCRSEVLMPWSQNLYVSYEQLLALRLRHADHPPAESGSRLGATSASASELPMHILVKQVLHLSVYARGARIAGTLEPNTDEPPTVPTPVTLTTFWLTHLCSEPAAANRLFAQYVYYDILGTGLEKGVASGNLEPNAVPVGYGRFASPHEGVRAAMRDFCPVSRREASSIARTCVEAYERALPLALRHLCPAPVPSFVAVTSGHDRPNELWLPYYGWYWFVDSLTLVLSSFVAHTNVGGSDASTGAAASASGVMKKRQLCALLLKTYSTVTSDLPALDWNKMIDSYADL